MNKKTKMIYFISVPVYAIIAFLAMYFLFNWSLKKSIIISGGGMIAMIIADSIAFYFIEKKKRKNINQEATDSTDLNTL